MARGMLCGSAAPVMPARYPPAVKALIGTVEG
jgi:hypothetical protein